MAEGGEGIELNTIGGTDDDYEETNFIDVSDVDDALSISSD